MKKYLFLGILSILITITVVFALPNLTPTPATVDPSGGHANVIIPKEATEVAPGVFDLGFARDVDGREVQGFAIVTPKKDFHHAGWHTKGPGGNGESCFAVFAKGARWKTTEPWVVNPSNLDGLNDSFVFNTQSTSLETWDSEVVFDIFGSGSTTIATLVADTSSPDNVNEVYFADIGSSGAIAVTIVWGIFFGPPSGRELVEWDQIYDDVDFDFGYVGPTSETENVATTLMDLQNIATHEDGHSAGLTHPSDGCTEETMYRFASFGETKKRTLNTGDIAGINQLYA